MLHMCRCSLSRPVLKNKLGGFPDTRSLSIFRFLPFLRCLQAIHLNTCSCVSTQPNPRHFQLLLLITNIQSKAFVRFLTMLKFKLVLNKLVFKEIVQIKFMIDLKQSYYGIYSSISKKNFIDICVLSMQLQVFPLQFFLYMLM